MNEHTNQTKWEEAFRETLRELQRREMELMAAEAERNALREKVYLYETTEQEAVTLEVEGELGLITLHFIFLDGGNITGCLIREKRFPKIGKDLGQGRVYVNGTAVKHPNDQADRKLAMRLACKRACYNLGGEYWPYSSMGPVGKKIYAAFRYWQRYGEGCDGCA